MIESELVELCPGIDKRCYAKEINQVPTLSKDPGNQYPDVYVNSCDKTHMKKGSIDIIDLLHPVGSGKEIHQENIGSCPEQDMLQCPVPCQLQEEPANAGDDHRGINRYRFYAVIY